MKFVLDFDRRSGTVCTTMMSNANKYWTIFVISRPYQLQSTIITDSTRTTAAAAANDFAHNLWLDSSWSKATALNWQRQQRGFSDGWPASSSTRLRHGCGWLQRGTTPPSAATGEGWGVYMVWVSHEHLFNLIAVHPPSCLSACDWSSPKYYFVGAKLKPSLPFPSHSNMCLVYRTAALDIYREIVEDWVRYLMVTYCDLGLTVHNGCVWYDGSPGICSPSTC